METNPNSVLAGWTRLNEGMDSGSDPAELPPTQCAFLVNITCRGSYPRTRPPVIQRPLRFFNNEGELDLGLQARFEDGLWQHASRYDAGPNGQYPIVVIGGRIFRIDLTQNYAVHEITIGASTPTEDRNPSNRAIGWSAQGGPFWVFNDGQTLPYIWDGGTARRAAIDELRPGRAIGYGRGRFWYSTTDGLHFRATDLVGGASGTAQYNFEDAVLKETENLLLTGGDFTVPSDSGGITAVSPVAQLDASQGQGPMQIFCKNVAFSVSAPDDRTQWQKVNYPIQTESLINVGSESASGTTTVNSDLWMRSSDGLRPFIVARREFAGQWSNTPMSFEMSALLDRDQGDLLAHSTLRTFDRRLLATCSPGFSNHGVFHRGLIALDFSRNGTMYRRQPPSYDGVWTGLRVLGMSICGQRCFVFVLSQDDKIQMWELMQDATSEYLDNSNVPIESQLVSRGLFAADIFNLKELFSADLGYDQLFGTVQFAVRFRPDNYPCWLDWHAWQECVDSGCPAERTCDPQPAPTRRGYRPKFRLPEPPDTCVDGVEKPPVLFDFFQVKLIITGPFRLRGFRAKAHVQPEAKYDPTSCDGDSFDCPTVRCCEDNPFTYSAEVVSS